MGRGAEGAAVLGGRSALCAAVLGASRGGVPVAGGGAVAAAAAPPLPSGLPQPLHKSELACGRRGGPGDVTEGRGLSGLGCSWARATGCLAATFWQLQLRLGGATVRSDPSPGVVGASSCPATPEPLPEGSCSCNPPERHGQTTAGREPRRADSCCVWEPSLPCGGDGGPAAPRLPTATRLATPAERRLSLRQGAGDPQEPLERHAREQPVACNTAWSGAAGAPHGALAESPARGQRAPSRKPTQSGAGHWGPPPPHGRPVPPGAGAEAAGATGSSLGPSPAPCPPPAGHPVQPACGGGGCPWAELVHVGSPACSCWPGGTPSPNNSTLLLQRQRCTWRSVGARLGPPAPKAVFLSRPPARHALRRAAHWAAGQHNQSTTCGHLAVEPAKGGGCAWSLLPGRGWGGLCTWGLAAAVAALYRPVHM